MMVTMCLVAAALNFLAAYDRQNPVWALNAVAALGCVVCAAYWMEQP